MEINPNVRKRLIIVQGPTASGKTNLAIDLAKHFNTEIISGDSRQFYKEIGIGTAKPTTSELTEIKHHLIDSHSLITEVTAATYAIEARKILNTLFETKNEVVLVGGSGMFIDALTFGLDDIETSSEIKLKLEQRLKTEGLEALVKEVERLDPEFAAIVDKKNPVRIVRALEVIYSSGQKYSQQRKGFKNDLDCEIVRFSIQWEREKLYERINQRVEKMLSEGLLDEVKSVMHLRDLKALNTVGYKEFFEFLDGSSTLIEAIEKIKQHSRNYAKRQETWLKRYDDLIRLNPISSESLLEQSLTILAKTEKEIKK
jgi:tRNA dimethylallyltransferase